MEGFCAPELRVPPLVPKKFQAEGWTPLPQRGRWADEQNGGKGVCPQRKSFFQANESFSEEIISKEALSEVEPCKTLDVRIKKNERQPRWA